MAHALFWRKNRYIWSFSLLTPSRNRRTHLVLPPQSGSRHGGAKLERMRTAARHAVVIGELRSAPVSGQIQPLPSLAAPPRGPPPAPPSAFRPVARAALRPRSLVAPLAPPLALLCRWRREKEKRAREDGRREKKKKGEKRKII